MTREENILTLNEHLEHWKRLLSEKICDQSEGEKTIDALQNAIKALEQETCEDVIRRSDMLDAVGHGTTYTSEEVQDIIDGMPHVTPQPKMGQWSHDGSDWKNRWICSECGYKLIDEQTNYCPNCGSYNGGIEKCQ